MHYSSGGANLEGCNFKVNSDHLNHTWFNTKKQLSRRQAKWSQWIESYHSGTVISYKEGKSNLADPLSRRSDLVIISSVTVGDDIKKALSVVMRLTAFMTTVHLGWCTEETCGTCKTVWQCLTIVSCVRGLLQNAMTAQVQGTLALQRPFRGWPGISGGHTWEGQYILM